ncbi:hypothetical protein [Sphingomonas hengshuiensis]|uniref:Uncharacterized protein n=1 Tax=Sphingomonas hengshuiensis TaxID=1609977 RepID=A0A7U4J7I7_9SPHN|nr:hypothetical protein [Sphingomonas hengshuiensis]AJP71685.1 hypothetical protein TS85_07660 [Sphingomonas hengshuiensis]
MNFWQHCKAWLATATALPDSTLHALAGMLVLLAAAVVLRRVPWDWRAWGVLLALELANETYDMLNPASGEDRLGASLHDLWLTMLCPTLLVLLVPMLIRRAASRDRVEQPLE